MVKEENPVELKEVSAHQKEVFVDRKLNPSQSAAWRSFWLKVRELNMQEWEHPMAEVEEDTSLAPASSILT